MPENEKTFFKTKAKYKIYKNYENINISVKDDSNNAMNLKKL